MLAKKDPINPSLPSDKAIHPPPVQLEKSLIHTTFIPLEHEDAENALPAPPSRVRALLYLILSLLFFGIVYLYIENPVVPILQKRLFSHSLHMSWSDLMVKASTIILVIFLMVMLLRFVFHINLALFHSFRYTFKVGNKIEDYTPPISVIVPAFNEAKLIAHTLSSLLKLDYPRYEIIVVDDGSTDGTSAEVEKFVGEHGMATVRLVKKPNGGKATALNAGIQVATYNFVLCADGDSNLTKDTLRKAIRHFNDPRIGAVSGNVKVANRNNLWTKLQALEYIEGLNLARQAQSFLRLVNIIPGPVGLFRKDVIKEVGWYSSDTFAEDCDITLKILRQGWKIVYEPEAISWTEAPETLGSLFKQRYRWTRGILQAIRKNRRQVWKSFGAWFFMWFMALEAFMLPFMNIFATFYFLYVAIFHNVSYYLLFWWMGLTMLDVAAALFSVAAEKEEIRLVFYAFLYRLFFILIIDICKVLATIEELLGFSMNWGKLERIGAFKNQNAS
jgi:poly-beta-1,6 N-acetyl-D-glucosamine synthase